MKNLKDILFKIAIEAVNGTTDVKINSIAFDSRKVEERTLFIAQKGLLFDGHNFIDNAIKNGGVAIICEVFPKVLQKNITYYMLHIILFNW